MTLLLLAASLVGMAHADEQELRYTLLVDGKPVGSREVSIRYLPPDELGGEETRILNSFMVLDGRKIGVPVELKVRASAHFGGGTEGFVATVSRNAKTWQVQADQAPDGSWEVRKREGKELSHWSLRRSEVDLSSLGFMDPDRSELLEGKSSARVLMAETGQVWSGAWTAKGETELSIGGTTHRADVHLWSPDEGAMKLTRAEDGLLLRYATVVLGREVVAELQEVPPPRSFGTIDVDMQIGAGGLGEEEL